MATRTAKRNTGANPGFEVKLWAAADALAWLKSLGFALIRVLGMFCRGRRNTGLAR